MTETTDILPIANQPSTGSMREHLAGAMARVAPQDIRIATAYLTPDGFLELKRGMEDAANVRLLLGERPFFNRRGPEDVLSQPGEQDELHGPSESVDWYTFLEGGYPWLLLTHQERRELLARGMTPEAAAFDLTAWERVLALVGFLHKDGVEVRRFLGADVGGVPPERVLDHRSPMNRLHAKAYLLSGETGSYAAVGSSNLTKSGLSQNSELNLASYDRELAAQLEGWFDEKWELGQDCKAQFIRRLEECVLFGKRYTPWQVMLKSLHAAYGPLPGDGAVGRGHGKAGRLPAAGRPALRRPAQAPLGGHAVRLRGPRQDLRRAGHPAGVRPPTDGRPSGSRNVDPGADSVPRPAPRQLERRQVRRVGNHRHHRHHGVAAQPRRHRGGAVARPAPAPRRRAEALPGPVRRRPGGRVPQLPQPQDQALPRPHGDHPGRQAGHQGRAHDGHAHQQLGVGPVPPADAHHQGRRHLVRRARADPQPEDGLPGHREGRVRLRPAWTR